MKKEIIFILLISFLMISCNKEGYVTYNPDEYVLYQDSSGTYSFERPMEWNQIPLQNQDTAFINEEKTMLLASKLFDSGEQSLESYTATMKKDFSEKLNKAEYLGEEKMILNGNNAQKLVFSFVGGEKTFKHSLILIENKENKKIIMLTFTALLEEYDKNYIILQNALNTLKIN